MATATAAQRASSADAPTKRQDDKGSGKQSWFALLKQTFSDFMEDKAIRLAAALSLYTILSMGPLLVIAVKILSFTLRDPKTQDKVRDQVVATVGSNGGEAIKQMLANAAHPSSGVIATVVSVVVLLFSASGVFGELQDSLNTIWEVKPKPHLSWWETVKNRFLSLAMVFVIAFLLLVSLIVSAVLTAVSQRIAGGAGWLSYVVDVVVSIVVATGLFAAIFRVLPDVKLGWRDVMLGAFVTAVLFKLGQYGLALYFKFGSTTSAYGAFGSIIAVLLWAYYSSMILFFGAEFTQAYARRAGRWIEPEDHAVKMTEKDRVQQGIPSKDVLAAKSIEQDFGKQAGRGRNVFDVVRRPVVMHAAPPDGRRTAKDAAFAAGGLVLGAALGALGVEYLLHDPKRPTSRHAAAVKLDERLHKIERKLGSVSRIKDYLEDMDVKERIDRVEQEVRRAGTHVRARETGRPTWMVRLADAIGGRWSNL
jgi:membrane protein